MRTATLAVLALGLGGCGLFGYYKPTESDKQLNAQNKGAGQVVIEKSEDPTVKQAGQDVVANSSTLEKGLIGAPAQPIPYSPKASDDLRKTNVKEYEAPWYSKAWVWLTGALPVVLGVALWLGRLYPPAAPFATVLGALVNLKQKADSAGDDKLHLHDVQLEVSKLAADEKIGPLVQRLLKDAHLDAAIHAPEAPALPVTGAPPSA